MSPIARNPVSVAVARLRPEVAALPTYETGGASGMDLRAAIAAPLEIAVGKWRLIPSGIAVAIPEGYEIQIRPRSGLALRHGITLLNTPGTIDADYRGEIQVIAINLGPEPYTVSPGDRIAQMVLQKVECVAWQEVKELPNTLRGEGGFGSTGN